LQFENSLRALPNLLQRTLSSCFDADIFAIASSTPTDSTFLGSCVRVNQEGSKEDSKSLYVLSPSQAPSIGIVDRSANLEEAAEALLTARFSFNGKSPYAPDVVLVNEFVKKEFLNAVIRKSIDFMTGRNGNGVLDEKSSNDRRKQEKNDLFEKSGINVITSGASGTIAEITDR
jgi:aldehyde dehydrogenase (NAD+)